jgi:hypothetical protein
MDNPTPDPLTKTVKDRLQELTDMLGGEIQYTEWTNSHGVSGKRIIILYNYAETN